MSDGTFLNFTNLYIKNVKVIEVHSHIISLCDIALGLFLTQQPITSEPTQWLFWPHFFFSYYVLQYEKLCLLIYAIKMSLLASVCDYVNLHSHFLQHGFECSSFQPYQCFGPKEAL